MRKSGLLRRHFLLATLVDQTGDIAKPDVLALHAQFHQHVQAGNTGRAAAGGHHLDVPEFLAGHAQRIGGRRPDHNRRAVLVVMENRNPHALAAEFFNDETLGRLDVLEVDRPESGLQRCDDIGQFFRVALIHLDIETVDIGEFLEQDRLALHDRFGGQRADIAEAEGRRTVGHHRHQIAARGVFRRRRRVLANFHTGLGHTGRIGQRQITAVGQRLGGADLQLPRLGDLVIPQRGRCVGGVGFIGHFGSILFRRANRHERSGLGRKIIQH